MPEEIASLFHPEPFSTLLASVLDAVPAHVAVLDPLGNVVLVNAAWRRFNRDNGGDGLGCRGSNYLIVTEACAGDPDAQCIAGGLRDILAGHADAFEHEYPCHSPSEQRWFRCLFSPISGWPGGVVRGVVALHIDITARRLAEDAAHRNEARIRLIADAVPALISYVDDSLTFRFVNRRFEEWYGMPAETLIGRRLPDLLGDEVLSVLSGQVSACLAAKEVEVEGPTGDGTRWYRASLVPDFNAAGRLQGWFTLIQDATVARAREHELRSAQDRAQEENRAKSEFLAGMSHELRTPLNAIIGFSEVVMQELLGPVGEPRYRDYARDIHTAGHHLLGLINDVLDLSKIEAGQFVLRESRMDVAAAVHDCLGMIRGRASQANLRLDVEIAPGLPPVVADERLVRQVLLNLLANAVKFTPAGGAVRVAAGLVGGALAIAVSDTGIGILPENIVKVLEPWSQIDSAQARRHDGGSSGLGLPLSKRFVELHGGTLTLASQPNQGTTVTVIFPAERLLRG